MGTSASTALKGAVSSTPPLVALRFAVAPHQVAVPPSVPAGSWRAKEALRGTGTWGQNRTKAQEQTQYSTSTKLLELTCRGGGFVGPPHPAVGGVGVEGRRVGGVRVGVGVDDPHEGRPRGQQQVGGAMALEPGCE